MNRPLLAKIPLPAMPALLVLLSVPLACQEDVAASKTFLLGSHIPRKYFVTTGKSEGDAAPADVRDAARADAGLAQVNLLPCVSVLPAVAKETEIPSEMPHGAVLAGASAEMEGPQGEVLTAGLIIARIRTRKRGEELGGFILPYQGHAPKAEAVAQLERSAKAAFARRYPADKYELYETRPIVESFVPQKSRGAVMVTLAFLDAVYPNVGAAGAQVQSLREILNQ